MEVKIISERCIKPSSPTPPHLKTYNYSSIDQRSTSVYAPTVIFYNANAVKPNSIHETSSLLTRTLSETLTLFYPLAGRTRNDNVSIDCTDDGAHYVEARVVGPTLSQCLRHDVVQDMSTTLKKLLPLSDAVQMFCEPRVGSHVALIQVTFFPCGGLAIGSVLSHKIVDAPSLSSFLRAWAAAAAAAGGGGGMVSDCYRPVLSAVSVFPQNEAATVPQASIRNRPQLIRAQTVTGALRRFVFNASAIATLKEKSRPSDPSRVQVVTSLIIKSILRAFMTRFDTTGKTLIVQPVNLRSRANPPLSHNLFGNITLRASFPLNAHHEETTDLVELVSLMKGSVSRFDAELMRGIQGEEGKDRFAELAREIDDEEGGADRLVMCNSFSRLGYYEIDFGWGKPVWFACFCPDESVPVMVNLVLVNDTRSGEGLEVWVVLGEDDVRVLENDEELLSFVSAVDPSPLDLP